MNYMWKFMSNFKEFYNEINSATLTGAIDVVVIEQEDGSYLSSPFHVRFGKIGVLRSREKVVDIEINGEPVDIHMKLGESGEAFFVIESDDSVEFPSYLATSPIPSYADIGEALQKERESESSDQGKHWDDQQQHPEPIVIRSSSYSSSVPSGFTQDIIIPISDEQKCSLSEQANELSTGSNLAQKNEESVPQHSTLLDLKRVECANVDGSFADETRFRPIKEEEITVTCEVSDTSDLGTMDSLASADDDRSKSKKKRRRKPTIKRKQLQQQQQQQQQLQQQSEVSNAATVSDIDYQTAFYERCVSSADTHVDDIFQMDMEEDSTLCDKGELFDSANTEHQNASCQDGDSRSMWQHKSFPDPYKLCPYSDGEASFPVSPRESRPSTPKSDTEYEMRRSSASDDIDEHRWSWTWGELPVPPKISGEKEREEPFSDDDSTEKAKQIMKDQEEQRSMLGGVLQFMRMSKGHHKVDKEGMYLDDLMADDLDPEIANLYLSRKSGNATSGNQSTHNGLIKDDDVESGNGSSLPHSPHSVEGGIGGAAGLDSDSDDRITGLDLRECHDIAFSLCGNLSQFVDELPREKFDQHLVTYGSFCSTPNLFNNADLVVRVNGKYYNWQTAAPILMSLVLFNRPLPDEVVGNLVRDHMPKKPKKAESRGYSWFSWRRTSGNQNSRENSGQPGKWDQTDAEKENGTTSLQQLSSNELETPNEVKELDSVLEDHVALIKGEESILQTAEQESKGVFETNVAERHIEKYKKSLRLTTEQLAQLKLKEGQNEAVFSVTTAYQGTTSCKCHIYLWKHDDQIIISDIDGTITKSDVLGHILPIVGKSWAQSGVAQLFTKIKNNGYHFMYLSARAIGQARITRDYLRSIRQGDVSLPDGPLLLSPSSLISALHREVIEKKPEEFKINCLRDIQALFPNRNPFYAGYGNKINDVWAYRAVGIPMSRIFTINHKGELKHELNCTFQSSYSGLTYVVDHLFPPLRRTKFSNGCLSSNFIEAEQFSSFTFWRNPLPDVEIELGVDEGKGSDISEGKK